MRRFHRGPAAVLLAGFAAAAPFPAAAENTSVYTDLKLDECEIVDKSAEDEEGPGWAHWRCEGYGGWPVQVYGSDLTYFVSYGENAFERARTQRVGTFNSLHTRLEWRLKPGAGGKPVPFATILRFFMEEWKDGKEHRHPILVVTQLKPGAVCHVAYIDAAANKNANADAREAADRLAGSFDCTKIPERVGPQTPGVYIDVSNRR